MPIADLLQRKTSHFLLWRPRHTNPVPQLVIGEYAPGNPPTLLNSQTLDLSASTQFPDLWEIAAANCNLVSGQVYHYWFAIEDSNPYLSPPQRVLSTDPTAYGVDWRLLSPGLSPPYSGDDRRPASVIKYVNGNLVPCDPGGEEADWSGDVAANTLAPNTQLIIYELPTAWSRLSVEGTTEIQVGSFRDVVALLDPQTEGANFDGAAVDVGRGHIYELGVNALELLPPADSFVDREWGYATSNYFAPDHELGFPSGNSSPTPISDLTALVATCHRQGLRFFVDMVMAFGTRYSYRQVNFLDFHVQIGTGDPEQGDRDGFGGDLFKYNYQVNGYDPLLGTQAAIHPARRLMLTHLHRWMRDFRVDGLRLDSIVNIDNWDFVKEFNREGRSIWNERWNQPATATAGQTGADARFLVIGEELAMPMGLLNQNVLDSLWNEPFKRRVRSAVLGRNANDDPDFETTVRRMIDCTQAGFSDGAQAINYLTSHDVGGFANERLYNFVNNNGVSDTKSRIQLAFACLLTAVGIPMILAGEEFADQHDVFPDDRNKQTDPVNFDRAQESWRQEILTTVKRLVELRKTADALARNETDFLHVDFSDGKRVLVWHRGLPNSASQVVVVANFSDWGSNVNNPNAEYVIPNWPSVPNGRRWREVTQARNVPSDWAGREPLFPWEAKVYSLI